MKKRFLVLFLILSLLSIYNVFSHDNEEQFDLDHSQLYPLSQLAVVGYGSLIFGILIIIILLFHKIMNDAVKKIVYFLIIITTSLVTIYLVLTTLHLNVISITKGPVHWHADFEIWVCDSEIKIAESKGLSNKQGVDLMHAHNDNRIHVEGVILDTKQASLGAFFHAIGGAISSDGIKVPTDEGLVSVHEGDKCNEQPARLYVFVNGKLIDNPPAYVIAPYEKVPPGDRIKIVFTKKLIEEINSNIGGIPLGTESEKFFDEVMERLQKLPPEEPMMEDPHKLCDLNYDESCNAQDIDLFNSLLGKCWKEGSPAMEIEADFDFDGCITNSDQEILNQLMQQNS